MLYNTDPMGAAKAVNKLDYKLEEVDCKVLHDF